MYLMYPLFFNNFLLRFTPPSLGGAAYCIHLLNDRPQIPRSLTYIGYITTLLHYFKINHLHDTHRIHYDTLHPYHLSHTNPHPYNITPPDNTS